MDLWLYIRCGYTSRFTHWKQILCDRFSHDELPREKFPWIRQKEKKGLPMTAPEAKGAAPISRK